MMKIYTYISLPGLLIHELSHILFGFLCGYNFKLKESFVNKNSDGSLYVGLVPKKNKESMIQSFLVALSPMYVILTIAVLAFFNPIFLAILIYFIVTYVYSFPSRQDFLNVRYAKVYNKYAYDDPTFVRFMEMKGLYKEESNNDIEVELESPED